MVFWFLSGARRLLLTTFALIVSSSLAAFHLFMTVGLHFCVKVSLPVLSLSLCYCVRFILCGVFLYFTYVVAHFYIC